MKIEKYTTKSGEIRYKFDCYVGKDDMTGQSIVVKKRGYKTEKEAIKDYNLIKESEKNINTNTGDRFVDVYNVWMDNYSKSVKSSTLNKTKELFKKHILPNFRSYKINKIKHTHCQKFVNKLYEKNLTSFSQIINYAKNVFDYAYKTEMISNNPFNRVIVPKIKKKKREYYFYNAEQLKLYLDTAKEVLGIKWYLYLKLLALTGMRRGEALALNWNDIDFRNKKITIDKTLTKGTKGYEITTTKTESSNRVVYIDNNLAKELLEYKRLSPINIKGIVFAGYREGYCTSSTPRRKHQAVIDACNLPKIRLHDLRHTHCSLLLLSGMPIKEVQDRLGHGDIKTTMDIYAHVFESEKKDIGQKFADFLGL